MYMFTNYWNFDMQYKIYYTITCYACRFLSSKQSAIFTKTRQTKPNNVNWINIALAQAMLQMKLQVNHQGKQFEGKRHF